MERSLSILGHRELELDPSQKQKCDQAADTFGSFWFHISASKLSGKPSQEREQRQVATPIKALQLKGY